jgi:hypothetical protein
VVQIEFAFFGVYVVYSLLPSGFALGGLALLHFEP